MQTEVSTDSLYDSTRRLLGDGVVFCIAYNTVFQTHLHNTVGSNLLFQHNTLNTNKNIILYALYDILL
jgi:hypothetical protein